MNKILQYFVNDENQRIAFKYNTKYNMAIAMGKHNDAIQLVHFQQIELS